MGRLWEENASLEHVRLARWIPPSRLIVGRAPGRSWDPIDLDIDRGMVVSQRVVFIYEWRRRCLYRRMKRCRGKLR